ncbi:MAG TPA: energy transducer TonB [Caulobacteraceae bacterium]|nr:energy transducer TonB [Caulobacteraceae bacterium]
MNRSVGIAAALLALATAAQAAGQGRCEAGAHVELPRLREGPSDMAIYMAYPLRAAANHQAGVVRVNCAVRINATLYDCRVLSEKPAGEGFGAHALDLADLAIVDPLRCDGRPVPGARVIVPLRFDPPTRTFRPH